MVIGIRKSDIEILEWERLVLIQEDIGIVSKLQLLKLQTIIPHLSFQKNNILNKKMKTNKFVVYFFIISIIFNSLLFGNESISKEPNPFVNRPNYLEILKIKPNIILDETGKPNLLHTSKKLKENLLSLKTIKLKGYYGIFFNNKKILLFTKFSKEGNIYNSFFITEQILFDAKLLEKY